MGEYASLEGRAAIVTGATGGIGESITLFFARAGADVALCGRQADRLSAIASEVRQLGRRPLPIVCDVASKADVQNMAERVRDEFGKVDILVNCAGIYSSGKSLVETSEAEWDRDIDTNLKGTFFCCQAVAGSMMARRSGVIINLSSGGGINPSPLTGAYCVAKAGVIMLTRLLALELGQYNIRVNAVAPGFIKTGINTHLRPDAETEKRLGRRFILGRLGEPDDVSRVVLFLASDESAYVTGQTLPIDGGGRAVLPWTQEAG